MCDVVEEFSVQQSVGLISQYTWSSLQAEEFEVKGQEMEVQMKGAVRLSSIKGSMAITEILCEHKETGVAHFSHGLCQRCYEEVCCLPGRPLFPFCNTNIMLRLPSLWNLGTIVVELQYYDGRTYFTSISFVPI
jgi:hypothetical protein